MTADLRTINNSFNFERDEDQRSSYRCKTVRLCRLQFCACCFRGATVGAGL